MGLVVLGGAVYGSACIEVFDYKAFPPSVPVLRLPANNAYEGSPFATPATGSLRPRFSWAEATTTEKGKRISYELQVSADASFNGEVITERTEETQLQPQAALPISLTPPVGRRYSWRVRACVASNCSEYSPPRWLNLGRSDKDLNGDGYADVVVGASSNSEAGQVAGKAYVYFGGPGSSLDLTADGSMIGTQALDGFGGEVSIAPDLNGDGFSDLVIGAPFDDAVNDSTVRRSGSASVFYGRAGATFRSIPDVVLSSAVNGEQFGHSISSGGDLNGDGYSDLAVGAPYSDALASDAGRVYTYFGRSGSPSLTPNGVLDGTVADALFGSHVSTAGELDGDGLSDLLVDERGVSVDGPRTCQSFVYRGTPGDAFDGALDHRSFLSSLTDCGMSADYVGDVDFDGTSELVISLNRTYPDANYVHLVPSAASRAPELDVLTTVAAFDSIVLSAAIAIGDVNGDGWGDLMVTNATNVSIHLGRTGGTFDPSPAGILPASSSIVKSAAGDVNGDGFDDVLVGAPVEGTGGRVYLYLGGPGSTFDPTADAILNSTVTGEYFGNALE
jgi:hypothetical protein